MSGGGTGLMSGGGESIGSGGPGISGFDGRSIILSDVATLTPAALSHQL
jgi:hypothetical protein